MHVVLGHVGEVKDDHVADVGHVDAAGGDVGRNQHPVEAVLESLQRLSALSLGAVGVDARRLVAGPLHALEDPIGAALRPGEDQRRERVLGQQGEQQRKLLLLIAQEHALLGARRGRTASTWTGSRR